MNTHYPFTQEQITKESKRISNLQDNKLNEMIRRLGRTIEYKLAQSKKEAFEALAFWSLLEEKEEAEEAQGNHYCACGFKDY